MKAYLVLVLCVASISVTLLIIIGIFHVRSVKGQMKEKKPLHFKISIYVTYFMLLIAICNVIGQILDLTVNTDSTTSLECDIAMHWGPTSYMLFKAGLYYILASRLLVVFGEVWYNKKFLYLWIFIMLFWCLFNLVIINMTVKQKITVKGTNPECQTYVALYALASMSLLDIVSGVLNIVLFTRPLLRLYKEQHDEQIKVTGIKQCVLSTIAILSTVLALAVIAIFNAIKIAICADFVISISCLILMYSWNGNIVEKIIWCLPKQRDLKNIKNIEIEIQSTQSVEVVGSVTRTET